MVTRRDIIGGIAGILAAQSAPAMLIGARTVAMKASGESVHRYAWCKSDGHAHIDLPVRCGCDISYAVEVEIPDDWTYGNFFGGYSPWASTATAPRYTSYLYINGIINRSCQWRVGNGIGSVVTRSIQIAKGSRFIFECDSSVPKWSVNGEKSTAPSPSANSVLSTESQIHFGMFAVLTGSATSVQVNQPPVIFRSAKVWQAGTLVFDAEFRQEDGIGVVYNAVDGTRMQTRGTGILTVGDD